MKLVVVESPAKANTVEKYLGQGYRVLASKGHIRDLLETDGSVDPNSDFLMRWRTNPDRAQELDAIAKAVKEADGLILATDPDREGEAISWHVLEVLRQKRALKDKPVKQVVFNSITKQAVLDAMANPREIDPPLVDAYLARRALDYLVGFTLSPVLWRKLPGARSAGRVQSVALRFVCDREAEIERFVRQDYWLIAAILGTPRDQSFEARLTALDGKKLDKLDIKSQEQADDIKAMLDGAVFKARSVEAKPTRRNPAPPFTTSTLQQAASSRLGFSAQRTMQVAQRLYEGLDIGGEATGLITYMRTDGVQMAPEAISAARAAIAREFGVKYVPEKPRYYTAKAKNAQEAHEAIRPTDFSRTPAAIRKHLDADQARLYELIWKRAIASQMPPAEIERTTVEIEARNGAATADLRAVGSVVRFDGFIAAYTEQKEEDAEDEENRRLPEIRVGEMLDRRSVNVTTHTTEPPPRYSEASFIKKMEELGIGRPSTYVATLKTLEDRDYVKIENRKLLPQPKGRLVTAFMESFFEHYVEYDFTASLEEKLDEISDGKLAWKDVLRDFWRDFSGAVDGIKELRVTGVLDALNEQLAPLVFPAREDGSNPRICPRCGTGNLSLKLGQFGAFVGCSNYPECGFTRQLGDAVNGSGEAANGESGDKVLGKDPYTAEEITLRSGRFGPYVQRGEGKEAKRSSLPKGWTAETMDHEKALALLSLPRDVGKHPETGKMISAGLGRYGPFLLHDGAYANIESIEDVFSIGIHRAVSLIAEKQSKGRLGHNKGTPKTLKPLGEHPDGGEAVRKQYSPNLGIALSDSALGKILSVGGSGIDALSSTAKSALRDLGSRIVHNPPQWWSRLCLNQTKENQIALFKGMVICERDLGWRGGSPTPTQHVFREIVRHSPDEFDQLLDWALRNRSHNPYTPLGFQTYARNIDEWKREQVLARKRAAAHSELMHSQQAMKQLRRARVAEAATIHRVRSSERKARRIQLINWLAKIELRDRFKAFAAQKEFPIWALPNLLFPIEMAAMLTENDRNNLVVLLTGLKGHWRLLRHEAVKLGAKILD